MFAVITDDKRHIKEDVEECALESTAFNYKRRRSATSHLTTNKYKIRTMMKYTPWQISEMGFLKYYTGNFRKVTPKTSEQCLWNLKADKNTAKQKTNPA